MLTKPPPGVMDDPLHPLSQGCVGHWLFNEGAGSLAYDVSGHGNHGTLKNMLPNTQGTKWQGSKFGGGVAFDGSDDLIDCGYNPIFDFADEITITALIYLISWGEEGYGRIVCKETSAYCFLLNNGKIRLYGSGIDHSSNELSVSLNTWQHVAVTYDRLNMHFYVNGAPSGSVVETDPIPTNASNLVIGNDIAATRTFDGIIDFVRIYNRALSAKEVKQLYHDPFCNLMQVSAWQLYTILQNPYVGMNEGAVSLLL